MLSILSGVEVANTLQSPEQADSSRETSSRIGNDMISGDWLFLFILVKEIHID